jgi:hypothetical protein
MTMAVRSILLTPNLESCRPRTINGDGSARLADSCRQFGAAGRERFLSTFTNDCFQARFSQALSRQPLVSLAASMP